MGAAQAVPIVGEIVSVAESGGKVIFAGACAAVGETKAADELLQGAGQTWKNYTEVNAIAANINMAVAAIDGDHEKVELLKKRQGQAWVDVAESTPVVGHVVGVARYATGDSEGGDRCMLGATRSAVVVTATVATGGAGALACGAAAAVSGLAYDGAASIANSAAKKQFAPVGFVEGVDHAVQTGNANDVFDALGMPLADAAAGALHGALKGKAAKVNAERSTPAAELVVKRATAGGRRPSVLESYKPYPEVPGSVRQVSLAELRGNGGTAGYVKEFQGPAEAMSQMERGQKYDFVRMQDGRVRAITHRDAANAGRILGDPSRLVGHTSLVEPGTRVVAAGEMHLGATGIIENINCQSGHFRVPLSSMRKQMGRVLPRSVLTFESPTFTRLLSAMAGSAEDSNITHIAIYTPALLVPIVNRNFSPTPLSSSSLVLAFHEDNSVKIIGYPAGFNDGRAEVAFDSVDPSPTVLAKVLIRKPGDIVVATHGETQYVDMCKEEVRQINRVFPLGGWKESSKDIEAWFDSASGSYQMRCACLDTRNGAWEPNEVLFKLGDYMENRNGKLIELIN